MKLALGLVAVFAIACTKTVQPPASSLASAESTARMAAGENATADLEGNLRLRQARAEIDAAVALMREGKNDEASRALARANADAELALELARANAETLHARSARNALTQARQQGGLQ